VIEFAQIQGEDSTVFPITTDSVDGVLQSTIQRCRYGKSICANPQVRYGVLRHPTLRDEHWASVVKVTRYRGE
jgi:uncharacterized protein (DUF2236 family)